MSCHTCAATFGFLKRELGCPRCGFSFCSKCLKYEVKDSKSTIRVCRLCSQKEETAVNSKTVTSPGTFSHDIAMDDKSANFVLRRLETLEDPSRPPVVVYTQKPPPSLQNFQMKTEPAVPSEQELRGRLQKLRQRLKTAPSVEEMEVRLAQLQGMPLKTKSQSIDVSAMPVSNEEQTCNLMQQLKEESKLSEQSNASWQKEIEARLARLKGIDPESKEQPSASAVEDMETEPTDAEGLLRQLSSKVTNVDPSDAEGLMSKISSKVADIPEGDEESELAIVNRILAEVALEEKLEDAELSDDEVASEPIEDAMEEELPWCCICNADASLRCPGCAGDLYCSRCFKEGHDVCDMDDHKPVKYQAKCPV